MSPVAPAFLGGRLCFSALALPYLELGLLIRRADYAEILVQISAQSAELFLELRFKIVFRMRLCYHFAAFV